jgi:hypothetical protein
MKIKHYSILIILFGLTLACKTEKSKSDNLDNEEPIEIAKEKSDCLAETEIQLALSSEASYGYIKDMELRQGQKLIHVDFIQFYDGDRAVQEAVKRGDAEYDIEENGDTTYFVYNDYYIANDNPKLRLFAINDSTEINLIEHYGVKVNFDSILVSMNSLKYVPFYLETKNGIVTTLNEIYTP